MPNHPPMISRHSHKDRCHLCGVRTAHTADVWYSVGAKRGTEREKYVRVCLQCAQAILTCIQTVPDAAGPG